MQADKLQRTADHHDIVTELVTRARAALARIQSAQVTGCAERFDEELRAQLDPCVG